MIGSLWIRIRRAIGRLVSGQSLQWRMALLTGLSVAVSVLFVGVSGFLITRWSLLERLEPGMLCVNLGNLKSGEKGEIAIG